MAGPKNNQTAEEKAARDAEEQAKLDAEKAAEEEQARLDAEKAAEEEQARLDAEEKAAAEVAAKEQSEGSVVVTFVKPYSRYSRGDVAGFEASEAARLVKGKVAVKGTRLPATKADQDQEPKA